MKKIPTIFKRDPENMRNLLNKPHPDCRWVFSGEGVATKKHDGTCVKIEDGKYFKRREIKKGKSVPGGFIKEDLDINTGKTVGWVDVDFNAKEDKWHVEGYKYLMSMTLPPNIDGTYELIGPKVQGNPEKYDYHYLQKHSDSAIFNDVPRTFDGISEWLSNKDIEGIVFHHPDGRMGKIKKRDFGLKRV